MLMYGQNYRIVVLTKGWVSGSSVCRAGYLAGLSIP